MTETEVRSRIKQCAVVILNWNGIDDSKACVQSLLTQSLGPPSIWIVDNASCNNEYQRLVNEFGENDFVTLVSNDKNLGFSRAHNAVFKELLRKGFKWVACLNNDAIADVAWLEELMYKTAKDDTFCVGSWMLQQANPSLLDNVGHFMLNTGEIIPLGHGLPSHGFRHNSGVIGACAGACIYNLRLLSEIGFFDEQFFLGYEDAELGLRGWLLGYETVIAEKAVVHHRMSASIGKIRSVDYLAQIQAHIFYSWFKLMPMSVILFNLPFMLFKYGFVLLIDIVLLRFKYLKVMLTGIKLFSRELPEVKRSRSAFLKTSAHRRSFYEINSKLTFFLAVDAKRFWSLVVSREKSNLEA
jgi:GT2 family glycosyltransferase